MAVMCVIISLKNDLFLWTPQLLGAMGDLTDDRLPLNSPLYLFPTKDAHVPLKGWAEEHGLSSRACDLLQLGGRACRT